VISPASVAGTFLAPSLRLHDVWANFTAELATSDPKHGCSAITNNVTGKIVYITSHGIEIIREKHRSSLQIFNVRL
jgi:glucokinase